MGSFDFTKARTARCSQKDGKLFREAFLENVAPVGQLESGLLLSRELKTPQEITRKDKEVLLVRADDTECLNFRFTAESLTKDWSLLRLFILTCETPDFEDLICNRGCYKAVSRDCHKVLDESDMLLMFIGFPTPLNFLCKKCPLASHH